MHKYKAKVHNYTETHQTDRESREYGESNRSGSSPEQGDRLVVSKAVQCDVVHGENPVPAMERTTFRGGPSLEDGFDVDGQVSEGAPAATDYAEPQSANVFL